MTVTSPWLLEPRRRNERALLAVVQQAYVEGVSTRKVDRLVKSLGCEGISKSQVSRLYQELDATVESFLGPPLDGGPYPYLWLPALAHKRARGRADRERQRRRAHGGQRRRPSRDPGHGRGHQHGAARWRRLIKPRG